MCAIMKHTFLLFLLLLCAAAVVAQERPSWVDGYFNDLAYSYIKTASASGFSEEEALEKAVAQVIEARSQESGIRMKVTVSTDGRISSAGSDNLTVKARVIDRYTEYNSGQYRVSILAQVAKNPTFDFDAVRVTDEYGFSPSVFVPGMEQLQKGSKGKGFFFIGAETAFIGTIVVAECMRSSFNSKVNTSHDVDTRRRNADSADRCATVRNVAIAGALAVYAWNVIDGIVAKGKKHIVVAHRTTLDVQPFFTPGLDGNAGGGISLCLNF